MRCLKPLNPNSKLPKYVSLYLQLGTESMNMRQAMQIMKEQAAEMALKAQRDAEAAAAQRGEADQQLTEANSALQTEREKVSQLQVQQTPGIRCMYG